MGDRIKIFDWINIEKQIKVFYSATTLVLPSYSEGIPIVILEAMATMTPVLATDVNGLAETLDDGLNAIITEPKNVRNLRERLNIF